MKEYHPRSKRNLYQPGKPYKLSRSKIQLFLDCPRCFYLDRKLGIRKPPEIPFNLNLAVDRLLKNEFDHFRQLQKPHPIITKNNLEAVPFQHKNLETWRQNFQGITHHHNPTKFTITGAIDDLWINSKNQLIIIDYKATAKNYPIQDLSKIHKNNLNQLDLYHWLFSQNNLNPAPQTYFLYCNGGLSQTNFKCTLHFQTALIPYQPTHSWIEPTLSQIFQTLNQHQTPTYSPHCNHCQYLKTLIQQESTQTLF